MFTPLKNKKSPPSQKKGKDENKTLFRKKLRKELLSTVFLPTRNVETVRAAGLLTYRRQKTSYVLSEIRPSRIAKPSENEFFARCTVNELREKRDRLSSKSRRTVARAVRFLTVFPIKRRAHAAYRTTFA